MTQAILLIGNDQFRDAENIEHLSGAAADAHRGAALFEQLGFITRVLTHDQLRHGGNWRLELDSLMAQLHQAGDTLGIFIATHGLTVQDGAQKDQLFLLHDALMADIRREIYDHGVISLRKLDRLTQRPGLRRFFILDACRSHIEPGRKLGPPEGSQAGVVLRDLRLNRSRPAAGSAGDSPLVVFNACADQQVAREIKKLGTGLCFEALRAVVTERQRQGMGIHLNAELAATVGGRMRQLALANELDVPQQDPMVEGPELPLWLPPAPGPQSNTAHTDARLLQAAEEFPSEAAWIAVLTGAHSPGLQQRARQELAALRRTPPGPGPQRPTDEPAPVRPPRPRAWAPWLAGASGLSLLVVAVGWGLYPRPKPLLEPTPVSASAAAPALNLGVMPDAAAPAASSGDAVYHQRFKVWGGGSEIKDLQTGLVWARCSVGQRWKGEEATCVGDAKEFTFDEAQKLATGGWRVPTVRELSSLLYCSSGKTKDSDDLQDGGGRIANWCDGNYTRPTIRNDAFPNTPDSGFWTSSPYAGGSILAWFVYFNNGNVHHYLRSSLNAVRLVRASQ